MESTSTAKAMRTARWARTMTKWLVTYSRSKGARWNVVDFCGPIAESRGVVDLIAIRKDHRRSIKDTKRGDVFESILIQCKGGSAPQPTREDILRLRRVSSYHRAKTVVLAEWKKGKAPDLYVLERSGWVPASAQEVFA